MAQVSEGARALQAWVKGNGEASELAREGAREVIDECRRLREIQRVMQESALGEAAMVEVLRPTKEAALRFIVCCGSRDEEVLAKGIWDVLRRIFDRMGVDLVQGEAGVTGTLAMDAEVTRG